MKQMQPLDGVLLCSLPQSERQRNGPSRGKLRPLSQSFLCQWSRPGTFSLGKSFVS
jgi:hypothetical protein